MDFSLAGNKVRWLDSDKEGEAWLIITRRREALPDNSEVERLVQHSTIMITVQRRHEKRRRNARIMHEVGWL